MAVLSAQQPDLLDASRIWGKIGILSFGGPAAQIALMHRLVVDERKWLTEKEFLNALSFCMLLPGPEAMQLATYSGWRLHGVIGGLIAGLLFVLPGAAVILALSLLYVFYGETNVVSAMFVGIKAAVVIIVIEALLKVSKRALKARWQWIVAIAAFIGIFLFQISYPLIVVLAGFAGLLLGARRNEESNHVNLPNNHLGKTVRTVFFWLSIWWLPIFALWAFDGGEILSQLSLFFSKLAVVTFGGAYTVLAYMAQDVVEAFGWLKPQEMIDGLGLAETTPGPLILVTQFVGFLAAFKAAGIWAGIVGALVTLWVTFVPCFLWIFTGAPYIEWLTSRSKVSSTLAGISAAVVGVILNLSLWFAIHAMFSETNGISFGPGQVLVPDFSSADLTAFAICAISAVLLLWFKWNIMLVLAIAAALGLLFSGVLWV